MHLSRRQFLRQSALLSASAALGAHAFASAKSRLKIGYSAITWGGNDTQAIQDIASLGFRGIQLRSNAFGPYRNKPSELKALLDAQKLSLVMFSSGNVEIDPAKEESTINYHVAHASFVKALGGTSIQLTNSARPKDRQPTTDELKRLSKVMNEIAKQTADLGIQTSYHNHMNQLGETPEEVDVIVQEMNPKYMKLLLDVAHYHQGGGDPAKAIHQYKDLLYALHLKDVRCPLEGNPNPKAYKFVELGTGNVNLPSVFKALDEIKFNGWGIIELDGVPDTGKTALSCAETSKKFLQSQHIAIG
ncbi:sugar phosphate isomerase/epimerase family protein [Siphonobacter aquaeclarae]|uniref:2-keto-myo-inositol dehydratase n=1 Tax=Siphonobacter aquaeclarae TaxID=563176 RepID=A0A1G9WA61_9BACT|nr:sugar phosphate isomerase/epimerase [Siphonobacter aquaeclarae]SDM81402.1 2-keto-myo-inositol dehydratase [Siphonobacter aquaeclarae]